MMITGVAPVACPQGRYCLHGADGACPRQAQDHPLLGHPPGPDAPQRKSSQMDGPGAAGLLLQTVVHPKAEA